MKILVLDASSVLRFADNEAGADRLQQLADLASIGDAKLYISPVNWGEVIYAALRVPRTSTADQLKADLHLEVTTLDQAECERAGHLKYDWKIPYADCFAASLAATLKATLVTADYDFKPFSTHLQIEFLPQKP